MDYQMFVKPKGNHEQEDMNDTLEIKKRNWRKSMWRQMLLSLHWYPHTNLNKKPAYKWMDVF